MDARALPGRQKGRYLMAGSRKQTNKPLIAGVAAGAFTAALYAAIFGFGKPIHLLIGIPLALLVGWAASVMAKPLDTRKKAPEQVKEPIPITGNAYADEMISRGQQLMKQIREENDQIPDIHLTEKINEMDEVMDKIFRAVAEQPGKAPQIRKSMEYYLPTTLKMLSGYRVMDERKLTGSEADKTRKQIHEAMNVVVTAFRRQLDTMYQSDVLDVSTDVEVMETLLKQDGLLENVIRSAPTVEEPAASPSQVSFGEQAAAAAARKQEIAATVQEPVASRKQESAPTVQEPAASPAQVSFGGQAAAAAARKQEEG